MLLNRQGLNRGLCSKPLMPKHHETHEGLVLREENHQGHIMIDAVMPDYYARFPKPCRTRARSGPLEALRRSALLFRAGLFVDFFRLLRRRYLLLSLKPTAA
jgi:hypothetical protein